MGVGEAENEGREERGKEGLSVSFVLFVRSSLLMNLLNESPVELYMRMQRKRNSGQLLLETTREKNGGRGGHELCLKERRAELGTHSSLLLLLVPARS